MIPDLSRRGFLLGGAGLAASGALAQDATFSIGVSVTSVLVTVRDKHGHLVRDLTEDDFDIEEDGRPQEIRYFSKQSDLPLTIGLLVDISGSQTGVIEEERIASLQFLYQVLREGLDQAFIFRFYRTAEMLTYLSSDRTELRIALSKLGDAKLGADGTALHDTLYVAAKSIMRKQQGRKAIILLSDGVDTGSSTPLASAIEAAQRAETLVYCLGFFEQTTYGEGVLQQIAKETGGGYFKVFKKQSAQEIYRIIEDELRNQYSLGYNSDGTRPGYRKIRVTTSRKDLTVQAPKGYQTGN